MDYPSEYETAEGVEQSELDKVEGDIEFKDVTFRYGNRTPAPGPHLLHHPQEKGGAGWFLGFR